MKLFESDFALSEHSFYAHGENAEQLFECPTCPAEFKNEISLKDHINLIHLEEKKCAFCSKTFKRMKYLKSHVTKNHTTKHDGEIFMCSHCGNEYYSKKGLRAHIQKVHETKDYLKKIPCEICGEMRVGGKIMERHMTACKEKLENPVHPCPTCGKICKTKSFLTVHIRRVHSFTRCTICTAEIKNGYPFKKHMALKHDGEIFMCSYCGNKYYSKKRLKAHIQIVHELKKSCVCSLCGKSFKEDCRLARHIKVVHEGIPKFKCTKCDFTCSGSNQQTLRKHMEMVHEGKVYNCSQCPEQFISMFRLEGHIALIHDKSQLFQCPKCENAYRIELNLKQHIAFVHEKSVAFPCSSCVKHFPCEGGLKKHIRAVHAGVRYQCELCSESYSTPSSLKKHVESVLEGKDLSVKCPLCNKSLKRDALKRHIANVHEKKRPHECDICHERFAQSGQLKTHKKGKHKIIA